MNRYGQMAMQHWQTWLPTRYRALPDPREHFSRLGETVETQIADETTTAYSRESTHTDYLASVGEWNALRQLAQERVLAEMVFVEPEPQTHDLPEIPWETSTGMPTDPTHPLWSMIDDDTVSLEAFQTALLAWRTSMALRQQP